MLSTMWTLQGDPAQALGLATAAFQQAGFTVAPGEDGWSGRAEVGSSMGRFLGGGFVRRHIVDYSVISAADGNWQFVLTPAMSGASGGALGMSKAKKEQQALVDALTNAFMGYGLFLSVYDGVPGQQ